MFLSRPSIYAHLIAMLLATASWQAQAADAVIGMILKVEGKPLIANRAGAKRAAITLDYLKQDDVLLIGPGAALSFTSYEGHQIHHATGPCELKLSAGVIKVLSGAAPGRRAVPAALQSVQPTTDMVGGAIRMRGSTGLITVLSPGNGSQLSAGTPVLQWELAEAVSLDVELVSESTIVIPRQSMVASSHVLAVEQPLVPGKYRFKLYLQRDQDVVEQDLAFTVLNAQAVGAIRALRPAPQASDEEQLLYLDYLIRIKADDERAALMQSWAVTHPALVSMAQSIRKE